MKPARTKKSPSQIAPEGAYGLFSKAEAAGKMAGGTRNIHSSPLGGKDPQATRTANALASGTVPKFAWEEMQDGDSFTLTNSKERHEVIQKLLTTPGIAEKRDLKEKVRGVLEELITNAIFHSYRDDSGQEKYSRSEIASLSRDETVEIRCVAKDTGVFLSVTDKGGTHGFDTIAKALQRCYDKGHRQIEDKEGGAGLGLYMVFETVTHWKIVCESGRKTVVSCWISDKKSFDPDNFSFNYFEEK